MISLLLIGPLAGLLVLPIVWNRFTPSPALTSWLSSPRRAVLTLAGANTLILLLTACLNFLPFGVPLAAFTGPTLSFFVWAAVGLGLPLAGARRWAVALAGSAPYWLAAGFAWAWLVRLEALASPMADNFHAFFGTMVLSVVALGATLIGTCVVALMTRR